MSHSWHPRLLICVLLSVAAVLICPIDQRAFAQAPDRQELSGRQRELLRQTLGQLKAASDQHPQLFFIGFAGYGREAVFMREVLAVRELFDDRFYTKQRSIALINHPSTADTIPLASVTNLDEVLRHVGQLMKVERDTLFLFLSSHGERNIFAVNMPGLALRPLRPRDLTTMLDRSGIKRRVIVISACHSGSFIPALANPTTLVITAARADRSSFGCEDRRQWTYFGDAYFNQALRQETSFTRAFERAKQLIAEWEAEDGLRPSLPQIAGGEALKDID